MMRMLLVWLLLVIILAMWRSYSLSVLLMLNFLVYFDFLKVILVVRVVLIITVDGCHHDRLGYSVWEVTRIRTIRSHTAILELSRILKDILTFLWSLLVRLFRAFFRLTIDFIIVIGASVLDNRLRISIPNISCDIIL